MHQYSSDLLKIWISADERGAWAAIVKYGGRVRELGGVLTPEQGDVHLHACVETLTSMKPTVAALLRRGKGFRVDMATDSGSFVNTVVSKLPRWRKMAFRLEEGGQVPHTDLWERYSELTKGVAAVWSCESLGKGNVWMDETARLARFGRRGVSAAKGSPAVAEKDSASKGRQVSRPKQEGEGKPAASNPNCRCRGANSRACPVHRGAKATA